MLASECKEILYYWDYDKNKYKPEELTVDRQVLVHFKCPDCGKEWSKPLSRFYNSDRKCPECRKRALLVINNVNIMKFWDYDKNKNLDPNTLSIHTREKAYFACKDCGYEWHVEIRGRKNKSECPRCNGHYRKITYDQEYPRIAERYSPKNKKPLSELTGTDRKEYILMICPAHGEYEAKLGNLINNYNSQSLGCPACWNQKTKYEDSLEARYPELASELINLDPAKIRPGSNQYGKFICSKHKLAYGGKITSIVKHGKTCIRCLKDKNYNKTRF